MDILERIIWEMLRTEYVERKMSENLVNYSEAIEAFTDWKNRMYADKELAIIFLGTNLTGNKEAWANRAKQAKKQYAFAKKFRKQLLKLQIEIANFYPNHKKALNGCFYDFVEALQNIHLLAIDLRIDDEFPEPPDDEPKKTGKKGYPKELTVYIGELDTLCDSVVSNEKDSFKIALFDYFKPNGEFDIWIREKLRHGHQGRKLKAKNTDDYKIKTKWVEDFFRDQRKLLKIEKPARKNKKVN